MRVVVVGGGFSGIKAALELAKKRIGKIIIISKEPTFIHNSALFIGMAGKSLTEPTVPFESIFANYSNVEIVVDEIVSVDEDRSLVVGKNDEYRYDKLILALGAASSEELTIPGLAKHVYGLHSVPDIIDFQRHIQDEVVDKKLEKEYFVIGAGQTGVEVASALVIYLAALKSLYQIKGIEPKVVLVEKQARILPDLSKTASLYVGRQLKRLSIKVLLNNNVEKLTDNNIVIDSKHYPTQTAIWTSGSTTHPFFMKNQDIFQLDDNNEVIVNAWLESAKNIYVIGNNNNLRHGHMSLSSLQQAKLVAKNIHREILGLNLKTFKAKHYPLAVISSRHWGYVEWFGFYVKGSLGAMLRRLVELYGYRQIVSRRVAIPLWKSHSLKSLDDDF